MKRIKDLKTRNGGVQSISQDESLLDAANKFIDGNVGALIIYDGGNMVGILTKNDLVRCCTRRHATGFDELKIEQYMTRNPFTASIDDDLDDVSDIMIKKGLHHVPVSERGRAVGMVTQIDIIEYEKHLLDAENKELIRYIRGGY